MLVYDDADVQMAAGKVIGLKFVNTGQVCITESLLCSYVDLRRLCGGGRGVCSGGGYGLMITAKAVIKFLKKWMKRCRRGPLVCGGSCVDGAGYFMEPTILRDVDARMRVACEEVFGRCFRFFLLRMRMMRLLWRMRHRAVWQPYVFTKGCGLACGGGMTGSVCVNEPHYGVQLPHGGKAERGW